MSNKLLYNTFYNISKLIPDKIFLELKFRYHLGYKLDLQNPIGFNEKLQWLKLYDRKLNYKNLVDKYNVRKYISESIGEEYLVPILGVYNTFSEIDFDILPDQFVLKPNHTSGDVYICKDKSNINYSKLKNKVDSWMKREYYWLHREWPYKNIKPKLICEAYLTDDKEAETIDDYKFYCFNGIPEYCQVISDRHLGETMDFYDMEWNHLEFTRLNNKKKPFPHAQKTHTQPEKFDSMITLAEKLSKDFPFIRVDFYFIKGRIYFGELTFYPFSGFGMFNPPEWNSKIGNLIKLPNVK